MEEEADGDWRYHDGIGEALETGRHRFQQSFLHNLFTRALLFPYLLLEICNVPQSGYPENENKLSRDVEAMPKKAFQI